MFVTPSWIDYSDALHVSLCHIKCLWMPIIMLPVHVLLFWHLSGKNNHSSLSGLFCHRLTQFFSETLWHMLMPDLPVEESPKGPGVIEWLHLYNYCKPYYFGSCILWWFRGGKGFGEFNFGGFTSATWWIFHLLHRCIFQKKCLWQVMLTFLLAQIAKIKCAKISWCTVIIITIIIIPLFYQNEYWICVWAAGLEQPKRGGVQLFSLSLCTSFITIRC